MHFLSLGMVSAIALAFMAGTVRAQEAAPAADEPPTVETVAEDGVVLPPVEVESQVAPAKRNKKKQALRANPGRPATTTAGTPGASAPATSAPAVALPGIVVEGEKVVRTLRDTTTSIGVVTGQQIREQQIQDVQEALNQTANVMAPEGSKGNSGFTIRGINSEGLTQNQSPWLAPVISVIIDGATQNPEATRRGARGLWDVEQVEVLRGPQSTLQARNSLAGSVHVKTNDPTYQFLTILEGTVGENALKSGGFVFNAPIVAGQTALRIAGQALEGNKDIHYTDPANNELDDDRLRNIRGKLLVEPDSLPGLSALFTVARTVDTPAVTSVTGPDFFDRVFDVPTSSVDFRTTDTNNYVSDIGYDLGSGLTLRSITAYADTQALIDTAAGSPLQRDDIRDGGDFTQDIRLEIENTGNGLSGVIGLFYGSFTNDTDSFITLDTAAMDLPFGVVTLQDITLDSETQSMAAYADLRWRFLDRFVVIGGGRILKDEVKGAQTGMALDLGTFTPVDVALRSDAEFTEALPKLGLTYDLTPNQTVGFTYSKGYRPGFTELTLAGDVNDVDAEYLDAYEISYRSSWLADTLSLNGNVFYYDYRKQQVAVEDPLFPGAVFIVNADSSHSYGAEIEARWRPIPPLQLFASLGLLQTEFDEFDTVEGDFSGNEFPEAPGYNIVAGGMYKDRSGWFIGANVRHTDGYYSNGDLDNTPIRFVDGFTVLHARTGWEWEHYTLTLFAKNILDEEYVTSISQGATEATVGDEQLFGVTLRGRF